jgi:hypothetical protein
MKRHIALGLVASSLFLAGCCTTHQTTNGPVAYIVQPGDSAKTIVEHFHISMGRLSVLNPGVNLGLLSPGQKLYVSE